MNFRIIGKITGITTVVVALAMLPPYLVTIYFGEDTAPFLRVIPFALTGGIILWHIFKDARMLAIRDAFVTVVASWVTMSLIGCLPFYLGGGFGSFLDCFFESVSGFTTTGASILTDVEIIPKGILLWRSATHFIGGMGVLVLTTAVIPARGDRSQYLMRAEVPGPMIDKFVPKLSSTSKILYTIYTALTVINAVALLFTGLGLYDAANLALATAGTGGFTIKNASLAAYANPAADMVTAVFSLLFGINFSIYFLALTRQFRRIFKSEELRLYLGMIFMSLIILSANTYALFGSLRETLHNVFFTVSFTITSTGFSVTDHNLWPEMSRVVLLFLMLTGACAGSTGGGIKIARVLMLFKSVGCELRQIIHPRLVSPVHMDGKVVGEEAMSSVARFFGAYIFITFLGTFLISIDNFDFVTNFSAVIACMGNNAPGLNLVGPTMTFACYSAFSRGVLTAVMLVGRLEIFPILMLFLPMTWKRA